MKTSTRDRSLITINKLFSGGLYITLGAACISNLRITPRGPALILEGGGYPFLYEIGIATVLMAAFLRFFHGLPVPNKQQKLALLGLGLFYAPIFVNYFLRYAEMRQFIGGGQLRLQLEVWLLGTALILYPIKKRTVHRAMIVVVAMAIANSLYSLTVSQSLIAPLYQKAFRIPGEIRQSGFFEMPGYLGVLCAIAISWALWNCRKKCLMVAIVIVCGYAVIIADSRTGVVAILVALAAKVLSVSKTPGTLNISVASVCFALTFIAVSLIPHSFWADSRPLSLYASMAIWLDNPFGIPWGTFEQFNPFPGQAVSPHNWPAIALLHGGVLSLLAVVFAHIWLIKNWLRFRGVELVTERFYASLVLIMLAITTSSWFEQVLQASFAPFVYVTALGFLAQRRMRNPAENIKKR